MIKTREVTVTKSYRLMKRSQTVKVKPDPWTSMRKNGTPLLRRFLKGKPPLQKINSRWVACKHLFGARVLASACKHKAVLHLARRGCTKKRLERKADSVRSVSPTSRVQVSLCKLCTLRCANSLLRCARALCKRCAEVALWKLPEDVEDALRKRHVEGFSATCPAASYSGQVSPLQATLRKLLCARVRVFMHILL